MCDKNVLDDFLCESQSDEHIPDDFYESYLDDTSDDTIYIVKKKS